MFVSHLFISPRKAHYEPKYSKPNLAKYLKDRSSVVGICNPSWLTDEVLAILNTMLQVSPEKRPSAEEVCICYYHHHYHHN